MRIAQRQEALEFCKKEFEEVSIWAKAVQIRNGASVGNRHDDADHDNDGNDSNYMTDGETEMKNENTVRPGGLGSKVKQRVIHQERILKEYSCSLTSVIHRNCFASSFLLLIKCVYGMSLSRHIQRRIETKHQRCIMLGMS